MDGNLRTVFLPGDRTPARRWSKTQLQRLAVLWMLAMALRNGSWTEPHAARFEEPAKARVDICDAQTGDILRSADWTPELAALVRDVARSCREVDPAVQIRFPPGKILRVAFPEPSDAGMPEPVREIWIVLPHRSGGGYRVICFDRDHRMTVYRPSASPEPLRRWVERHPGEGRPSHRPAP